MSLTTNIAGEAKLRNLEMENGDPKTVAAIILGGGAGTRLFPLTKRCQTCYEYSTDPQQFYKSLPISSTTTIKHIRLIYLMIIGKILGKYYLVMDARQKQLEEVMQNIHWMLVQLFMLCVLAQIGIGYVLPQRPVLRYGI